MTDGYPLLSEDDVKELSKQSTHNQPKSESKEKKYKDLIYGDRGYMKLKNDIKFKSYYLEKETLKKELGKDWNTGMEQNKYFDKVHAEMDTATTTCKLKGKARVFMPCSMGYFENTFKIGTKDGITQKTIESLNSQKNRVINSRSFMNAQRNESMVSTMPIMFTLLCDEGTQLFASKNNIDVIFSRNTEYEVLGARIKNGEVRAGKGKTKQYNGLEIIARIVKKAEKEQKK
jgi:hypothetical protein